jgi:hypothetical protein
MTCPEIPNIPSILNELYTTKTISLKGDIETVGVQLDKDDKFEFEYLVKHPSAFDMMLGNIDINGWRPFENILESRVQQINLIDDIYILKDGIEISAKLSNSGNMLRIGELELKQDEKSLMTIPVISKSYNTLSDHFSLESSTNGLSGLNLESSEDFHFYKHGYTNLDQYLESFLPLEMHSTINDAYQAGCSN